MITGSVILYKHKISDIVPLLESLDGCGIDLLYIIDQGANKADSIEEDIKSWINKRNAVLPYEYHKYENDGYGIGHNRAIKRAIEKGSSYHVVLNPDVSFDKSVICGIEEYLDANPDVGQLMPKVYYPNGDLQRLCKLLPEPMDLLGRFCLPKFFFDRRMETFELSYSGYNRIMNVPYLSGCFMFFRISALKKVGLFDERFFMYAEDIDITRRIHEKYKTIFYPNVSIVHLHNRADRRSLRLLWIHMVNVIRYFNKWGWIKDAKRDEFNERILREIRQY